MFAGDPELWEDFHAPVDVDGDGDPVKKMYAEKSYTCRQCDVDYVGIRRFAKHLYAHTFIKVEEDELPTLCFGCGREFDAKPQLVEHITKDACSGTVANAKPLLKCQLCSLRFARKENMRKHLRQYAALARPMKDAVVFKCPVCPQIFGGKGLRDTHKLVHVHVAAVFPCPVCKREYKSKSSLGKHKKTCIPPPAPDGSTSEGSNKKRN